MSDCIQLRIIFGWLTTVAKLIRSNIGLVEDNTGIDHAMARA